MQTPPLGCPKCNYTGFSFVENDDSRVQQCICTYAKALKAHLGPEIASAPTVIYSPLYVLGEKGQPPKVDRTGDNLFIKTYWTDFLPHLKWTLACKGPLYRYRIVTDEKLRSVWFGKEAYGQRSKEAREELDTFNGLSDLIGTDLDLVIIRLGFLGYKNVAMPGILKESLMVRESVNKPTWIVEVPSSIFGPGHYSYNEDVAGYISRLFEVQDLTVARPTTDSPHGFALDEFPEEPVEDVGLGAAPPPVRVVKQPKEMFTAPAATTPAPAPMDMSALEGDSGYKKGKKSKRGGGGPV